MNIDFKGNNYRFNARASAIIFNKDKTKILLCKAENNKDCYFLPGGRIEINEDSQTAVKREIMEELGYDMDFSFCAIQENFAIKNNKKLMQYSFCYKGIYKGYIKKNKFVCKDNDEIYYYWIDISKIKKYKIIPSSVYKLIDSTTLEHIIEVITDI